MKIHLRCQPENVNGIPLRSSDAYYTTNLLDGDKFSNGFDCWLVDLIIKNDIPQSTIKLWKTLQELLPCKTEEVCVTVRKVEVFKTTKT